MSSLTLSAVFVHT